MRPALLLLPLSLVVAAAAAANLNFDDCRTTAECASPRKCLTYDAFTQQVVPCSDAYPLCMCGHRSTIFQCTSSSLCAAGEQCAQSKFMPYPACTSCTTSLNVTVVDPVCPSSRLLSAVSALSIDTQPRARSTSIKAKNQGLSADYCKVDGVLLDNCVGSRTCGNMYGGKYSSCASNDRSCYCLPEHSPSCSASSQCESGERCVVHSLAKANMCASCTNPFMDSIFTPLDAGTTC